MPTALATLKGRMSVILEAQSVHFTDADFERFLTAYEQNIDKSQKAIMEYLTWLQQSPNYGVTNIAAITQATVENEIRSGKGYLMPSLHGGMPIIICTARLHNPKAPDYSKDENTRFIIFTLHRAFAMCSPGVEQVCVLIDLKGMNMDNMDYNFVKRLIYLLTRMYPERLGLCLLVNPPGLFQACWRLILPLLTAHTQKKVHLLPQSDLSNHIPLDRLPTSLGGTSDYVYDPAPLLQAA
eukprot:NODE_4136_length_836_cov_27.748942_g3978_i0.p1 GENE.NODE_4136_length_836_cov_27.748942_g3978_i0~~NODE_4136_length_836_cov_27.748942_g3978_i0.p1  ORF type:complete len:257 (-),score=79.50 NODE_4136_length_836_cov_27.748942_g3978_i0:64-780(-)